MVHSSTNHAIFIIIVPISDGTYHLLLLMTINSTLLAVAVLIIFVVVVVDFLTVFAGIIMFTNSSGIFSDWKARHSRMFFVVVVLDTIFDAVLVRCR